MTPSDAATHVRAVIAARHALDALPPDALPDATHLLEALRTASPDERTVLTLVADGLSTGRQTYGPLDLSTDPRSFAQEALEEARDAAIYLAAALLQLQPLLHAVKHRWPGT